MTLTHHQNGIVILISFLLALVLSIMPLPFWAQDFRPLWSLLALLYWCLALPTRVGVGVGWTLGLFQDVLVGTILGQHALSFAVTAFLAVRLHQRIRIFPALQQAFSVLVLLLVERLLALWITGATQQPTPSLYYWLPVLVSAVLWPWIFALLRAVRRHFRVT